MIKKISRAVTTVLLVLLIILVVVMFITRIMGGTPSVFGYRMFAVTTGSMEPTLKVGDAILIKKTPASQIHKGDIITYKGSEDEMYGKPITHRVVEEPEKIGGLYRFQTQGDVEGATLDPPFTSDRVEGKMVLRIPLLGNVYNFFCKPYGLLTFMIIILFLFGYEMISLTVSYKTIDNIDIDALDPELAKEKQSDVESENDSEQEADEHQNENDSEQAPNDSQVEEDHSEPTE